MPRARSSVRRQRLAARHLPVIVDRHQIGKRAANINCNSHEAFRNDTRRIVNHLNLANHRFRHCVYILSLCARGKRRAGATSKWSPHPNFPVGATPVVALRLAGTGACPTRAVTSPRSPSLRNYRRKESASPRFQTSLLMPASCSHSMSSRRPTLRQLLGRRFRSETAPPTG